LTLRGAAVAWSTLLGARGALCERLVMTIGDEI
jgi:hypothetical protein